MRWLKRRWRRLCPITRLWILALGLSGVVAIV